MSSVKSTSVFVMLDLYANIEWFVCPSIPEDVEQCFSLSATSYAITYTDDDGETTDITNESDLTEAIRYFHPGGDDPPMSSAASILSGRSFGRSKITLRVKISIEYDGPSLSDTSSLASMDDYKDRNGSEFSLSLTHSMNGSQLGEVDDDSVTVSSKDMGSKYDLYRSAKAGPRTIISGPSREPLVRRPLPPRPSASHDNWDAETVSSTPQSLSISSLSPSEDYGREVAVGDSTSGVFETLRRQENQADPASGTILGTSPLQSERSVAWLRDQNTRTIQHILGDLPAPSESDEQSVQLDESGSMMSGELALQKDQRGKFYYAYTSSGPSAPPSVDSGYEESSVNYEAEESLADSADIGERRPTSMEMSWIESQARIQTVQLEASRPSSSNSHANHRSYSEPLLTQDEISPDIPEELLPFITTPVAPPKDPTECSQCHTLLEILRYVCSTCGEKEPRRRQLSNASNGIVINGKGKARDVYVESQNVAAYSYPPSPPRTDSSQSVSSWTLVADGGDPFHDKHAIKPGHKPLPALPLPSPSSSPTSLTLPGSRAMSNGSSSPREPRGPGFELCPNCIEHYGMIHAVEACVVTSPRQTEWPPSPEDSQKTLSQWRRTASKKGQLRHAYYEKVWGQRGWDDVVNVRYKFHEIHPSHVFLVVPDKPIRTRSEPILEVSALQPDETGEICLPGNLDSSDDGHNSSHIMIKIPYPLPVDELKSASKRAQQLWQRDNTEEPTRSRRNSMYSAYARTVMGVASSADASTFGGLAHGLRCKRCNMPIIGIRYQCANCPSKPEPYSLCAECEAHSYAVHDPMHVFFKLHRPVDIPLESSTPFIPILYGAPAGPPGGAYRREQPKEYLASVLHSFALCDLCTNRIKGEWYRCVYCAKDLCDMCESVDTHDCTHFFMVFKSTVDMKVFRQFARLDRGENSSPPVVKYPVYRQ
ncbi:hypothetical protein EIP86_009238 [Pleurotus ostreatoroseus]|nr:hypothetical protein EIP86_009238 [Pleurotus ostreatoroseus]